MPNFWAADLGLRRYPFNVPSAISKAFWGGVWGAVLVSLLGRFSGASCWGKLDPSRRDSPPPCRLFRRPAPQGRANPPALAAIPRSDLLKGTWGFGTVFLLRLPGTGVPLLSERKAQRS
jgi:hypothetical protein